MEGDVLIPGLPNELAVQCLILLPGSFICILRRICRAWRHLVDGPMYPRLRKQLRLIDKWICVLPEDPIKGNFIVYNPKSNNWLPLPSISEHISMIHWEGFSCVVVGHQMFIMGGRRRSAKATLEDTAGPCTDVIVYNAYTNQWSKAASMNIARCWFASGAVGDYIYVAGGHGKTCFLDSVEVYDLNNNVWSMIPSMNIVRSSSQSVVLNNQFWVIGGEYARHQYGIRPPKFSAEFYDPLSEKWTLISEMGYSTEKIPGPCTVHKEKLLSIGDNKVLLYESSDNKWVHISGRSSWDNYAKSYSDMRFGFAFESLGDKLYIIGGVQSTRNSARMYNNKLNSTLVCSFENPEEFKHLLWREAASMGQSCGNILASCILQV